MSFDVDFTGDVSALPHLLDVLSSYSFKVSFACVGVWIEKYPEKHIKILEEGHEIINHTYTHPNLRKLPPSKIREQLSKTQAQIEKACGVTPRILRLPYGESSADVARIATQMRLDIFYWSIDTDDYKRKVTKEDIVNKVLGKVRGGDIILMHDKSQKVVDAVREIIDPIRKNGLVFVTCSDLAAQVRLRKFLKANVGRNNE